MNGIINGVNYDMSMTNSETGKVESDMMSAASRSLFLNKKNALFPSCFFPLSCEGAWWEVDLGEGVAVSRVTIYNRNGYTERLSNSMLSLLNSQGNTLKSYRIGDATNLNIFNISFVGSNGTLITTP